MTLVGTALRAPVAARTRRELTHSVMALLVAVPAFVVALLGLVATPAAAVGVGVPLLLLALAAARLLTRSFRAAAQRTVGWTWPDPAPLAVRRGWAAARALLTDGAAWRALTYCLVRLPLALVTVYGVGFLLVAGLLAAVSPFWWAVPALRGSLGDDWSHTWSLAAQGVAALLVAPWVLRGLVAVDRVLVRALLMPTRDQQRIVALEGGRSALTADAAATLQRLERDLHDGTQARLVAVGMLLSRLEARVEGVAALELLGTAQRTVTEGLDELREIIRGVHPPALDDGLGTALGTLAARSAVPARVDDRTRTRPSTAVASALYFATAELLANVARHAGASAVCVVLEETADSLLLTVRDDGHGGASVVPGSGLDGLRRRAEALDGSLDIASPVGGPTAVVLALPRV